jgi:HEAT repeat protein
MAGKWLALLIANAEYQHAELRKLNAPQHDVKTLAALLERPDIGGYQAQVLIDGTKGAIERAINRMLVEGERDDTALIFFAGHGLKHENGKLYFAAKNTEPEFLGGTAVSAAWLMEQMQDSRVRSQIVLLDCCFGGAFARSLWPRGDKVESGESLKVPDLAQSGRGQVVITAADAMQFAFEGRALNGNPPMSHFTRVLVQGLRTGAADTDDDGKVTVDEVMRYLESGLREAGSLQRPTKWIFGALGGDLLFAFNPRANAVADPKAKAARDFLAAKVPAFERTMSPLAPTELVYLYRYRRRIHPTEQELRLLLASMLHNIEARPARPNESPGAYWFAQSSPQDFLSWFIQIERWAANEDSSFRPSHAWVKTFPLCDLESQFAALATDPVPSIRAICAQWIARTKREEDLPLLRKLAKDEERAVRAEAVRALAGFRRLEDLPLLRERVKDRDQNVCGAALNALASFSRPEALPLLRELAKDQDQERNVRAGAVEALASYAQTEDLPLLRELAKDQARYVRVEAVKALASFAQAEDLPLLRELAKDQDRYVRVEAVKALASFAQAEVLPLLRELAKDRDVRAPRAPGLSPQSYVRVEAVKALASFAQAEDLPLLRELAKDWDVRGADEERDVRVEAVKALASFAQAEVLPLLRELALASDNDVAAEAVRVLASLWSHEELEAFLNRCDQELCASALAALDEVLYMPEWLKPKARGFTQELP